MTNEYSDSGFSDGMVLVADEYERWIADSSKNKDVRPLLRAAAKHLELGRALPLAELGPCAAILYFGAIECGSHFWKDWIIRFGVWTLRLIYRGRPMWNDFYMCLWQLSRDDGYIRQLYSHLKRANAMQLETGVWMVNSVSQHDEEFRERWQRLVKANGEVFA